MCEVLLYLTLILNGLELTSIAFTGLFVGSVLPRQTSTVHISNLKRNCFEECEWIFRAQIRVSTIYIFKTGWCNMEPGKGGERRWSGFLYTTKFL
jgi:hypothetical protein